MRGKVGYIYNWILFVLYDVFLGEKIVSVEFILIYLFIIGKKNKEGGNLREIWNSIWCFFS